MVNDPEYEAERLSSENCQMIHFIVSHEVAVGRMVLAGFCNDIT